MPLTVVPMASTSYGSVIAAGERLLRPGGSLVIEEGGTQHEALIPILTAAGFDLIRPWSDDDGDLRGIASHTRA